MIAGSFVLAGSLIARLGLEGWSSWGTFLVTGSLQGCLLSMGLWFEMRNQRRKREQVDDGELERDERIRSSEQEETAPENEETPLLRG